MGHTNVRTTQIYTHIVNEQKEKAANTFTYRQPEFISHVKIQLLKFSNSG